MDINKIKINKPYSLNWKIIKENKFKCDFGSDFYDIFIDYENGNKINLIVKKIDINDKALLAYIYSNVKDYGNWWISPNKIKVITNSVKKLN